MLPAGSFKKLEQELTETTERIAALLPLLSPVPILGNPGKGKPEREGKRRRLGT
jgi:hypothetical protein